MFGKEIEKKPSKTPIFTKYGLLILIFLQLFVKCFYRFVEKYLFKKTCFF